MQEIKTISAYRQSLRERILETAMRAFAENGIRGVKMDDIASRLSISKRTLYEIFDNKEDLLFEGVKRYHEQVGKRMRQIGEESANVMEILLNVYRLKIEEFRSTNTAFYSDIVKYPQILDFLDAEKSDMRSKQMEFLKRGVAEGYFRPDVDYELTGFMLDALGQYVVAEELYKKYPIEDIFKNLVFVTLRGFCTMKGIEVLDAFQSQPITDAGRAADR